MSPATVSTGLLDAAAAHPEIARDKSQALEWLGLQPGDRVLDVGCGPAHDLVALALVVGTAGAHGVDVSADALAQARHRLALHRSPLVHLIQASATSLPYPAASFDGVRADRLLQHLPDPDRAVAEMARVLRPGGRMHLSDTDWSTAAVSCLPNRLMERLRRFLVESWVPSPRVGSDLLRLAVGAGLVHATVSATAVTSQIPSMATLPTRGDGALSAVDVAEIGRLATGAAEEGHLVGSVTMFSVVASKP